MTSQLSEDEVAEEPGVQEETPQVVEKPREIVGPILGDCPLGKWDALRGRLPADARTARLFVTTSGKRLWFPPEKQPPAHRLMVLRVCHVYEIDMGVHLTRVEMTLPCRGDQCHFRSVVELRWQVADAEIAVSSGLSNVANALMPEITTRLRAVTRKFDIEQVQDAESAAVEELRDVPLGEEFGLAVRVFVTMNMDEPTLVHAALLRKVERMRRIIVDGDFYQFALQLSLNEESITEVVQALAEERQNSRQSVLDFLTRMLESDAIERWEIEDDLRVMIQSLREWGNNELAGVNETRSTSLGNRRRPPISGGGKS